MPDSILIAGTLLSRRLTRWISRGIHFSTDNNRHAAKPHAACNAQDKGDEAMGAIYDAMVDFFKKDEWPAVPIEGQTAMTMNFQGQNGRWGCVGRVEEEKEIILFYSYCPMKAPEDKRPIMADFLTRANYGLYIGNFEMDYNDGEIRFKTSIDVEGDRLSFDLMKRLVYDNVGVMDKYLPGIMTIIYGGASPTEAIAKVES